MNVRFYALIYAFLPVLPVAAQRPLSCEMQSLSARIRAEGHYEPAADIVIICSNGSPGAGVRYVGIEVSTLPESMPFTSRTLDSSLAITEALLFVDDPSPNRQVVCQTPLNPAACGTANVFPGIRLTSNRIRFVLPFVEPGPSAARVLRIANLRTAPSQLTSAPGQDAGFYLVAENTTGGVPSPQLALPLSFNIVDSVQPMHTNFAVSVIGEIPTYRCEDVNRELAINPAALGTSDGRRVNLRIAELPDNTSVLRRRSNARPQSFVPPDPGKQDAPGVIYLTETGFYNPAFPGIYANAGLADSGTRFYIRVHDVPLTAKLFVPDVINLTETNRPVTTGYARRVQTGAYGEGPFQGFVVTSPIGGGIAPMTYMGAYHEAIYEVLETDTTAFEAIEIPIFPALLSADGTSLSLFASVGLMPISSVASTITPRFDGRPGPLWRVATINGCFPPSIAPQAATVPAAGGSGTVQVTANAAASWLVRSQSDWITITSAAGGQGNGTVSYRVAENTNRQPRTGTISIGPAIFDVTQEAGSLVIVPVRFEPEFLQRKSSDGFTGSFRVFANGPWTVTETFNALILSVSGNEVRYSIRGNTSPEPYSSYIRVNEDYFVITQRGYSPPLYRDLLFVPVAPCRVADTREAIGTFGGPSLPGHPIASSFPRNFPIPQSACGIPAGAKAYSLNVTVVPHGGLGYVSVVPAGAPLNLRISTMNSADGRIKANAAIVAAGTDGGISVRPSNTTDAVIDINGYFIESAGLAFYPLPPCRVLDTRNPQGSLGGPILRGGVPRSFPVQSSACGVPPTAAAYSLNATVVPSGGLGYLTLWPTGQPQPFVSTLNSHLGTVVANAAIVPAGNGGAISAFATNDTHLVIDINGYFAPPGDVKALRFTAITTCRAADTRTLAIGLGFPFLPGGILRNFPLPFGCELPDNARAYSLNATVVPMGGLGYLSMWSTGEEQPYVSTLNAADGAITSNALIVPAGVEGMVSAFATNPTNLILDVNGYFAP